MKFFFQMKQTFRIFLFQILKGDTCPLGNHLSYVFFCNN